MHTTPAAGFIGTRHYKLRKNQERDFDRIIDVFPENQQSQVRTQLSFVLEGVLSQTLMPQANGKGRVMALEVMIPNPAIRNLIREDKIHQIYSQMQIGQDKFSMQTLNQSLFLLAHARQISQDDAMTRSHDLDELKQMFANPASVLSRRKSINSGTR